MRARDIARDSEAEAGAAFVLVARVVEAKKRLEHVLTQTDRDTRAVIVHRHRKPAMIAMPGNRDSLGETSGIGDEVGEAALERRRPHRDLRLAVERHGGTV